MCVTSVVRRFLEALRLFKKTKNEAASGDVARSWRALAATHVDSTVLQRQEADRAAVYHSRSRTHPMPEAESLLRCMWLLFLYRSSSGRAQKLAPLRL